MGESTCSKHLQHLFEQPLCRRYFAVVFSATALQGCHANDFKMRVFPWALSSSVNGDTEIVGAWHTSGCLVAHLLAHFRDLHLRGAEFIRFGVGDFAGAEAVFCQTFRHSEVVPSVEQALASVAALVPPRHRDAVRDALRAAADAVDGQGARALLAEFQGSALGERYPAVVARWGEALARFEPIFGLHPQQRGLIRQADRTAMEVQERLDRAIKRHGPFDDSAAALEFVTAQLLRVEQRMDRDREAALDALEAASLASSAAGGRVGGAVAVPPLG